MKKALKIIGIVLGSLIALIGVAAGIAAITGVFSNKKIKITALSWETDKVRVVDDYTTTINFLPANANQLDVELKLDNADASNIVEIPSTVKAGEPFTIKLKKDANGNNIGGEVVIEAKTQLVVSSTKLKILVDVPIPNNGLVLASDYDGADEEKLINAGSNSFGLYVFTNPNLALNPNTGNEPSLLESYKDITITTESKDSGDSNALQILTAGIPKEGFYCPDYIAHGHKGPFKDAYGNYLGSTCHGKRLSKHKFIEYTAKAVTSAKAPVIISAKALRTYSMQDEYVDEKDTKYYDAENNFKREEYYTDLSNYISEYQDYIKADTRPYKNPINDTLEYENGAAFIAAITQTNSAGENYIKINDTISAQKNAAYFYMYVESKSIFNIEEIDIKEVKSTVTSKVEFEPHGDLNQYTVKELQETFGLSLIPTNQEDFTPENLKYRLNEIRILPIKNKSETSTSTFDFDLSNIFEIENPTSIDNPVWKIRCVNPISNEDRLKGNYRLRFYIPSSKVKTELDYYTPGDKFIDIGVEATEVIVSDLKLFTSQTNPQNALDTTMITNTTNVGGRSYRQDLDSTRYELTGPDGKTPTYTLVKYFVTDTSAKTKDGATDTSFFKVKLCADGGTPILKQMPYNTTKINAYEIDYYVGGKCTLEAINSTNGDSLEVFAAVVKTDYLGRPIDVNGVSEGEEGYNGVYQIAAQSNKISINIYTHLEKLNFYTVNTVDGEEQYTLRNVSDTGDASTTDTIQLLAGEEYKMVATPFYLNTSGTFDAGNKNYVNGTVIDYKTNLTEAMKLAQSRLQITPNSFVANSTDISLKISYMEEKVWFDLGVTAKVNKSASANYTPVGFDLKAIASPNSELTSVFNSSRSSVNMIVNYAAIDSFVLETEVNTPEHKISPRVGSLEVGGQSHTIIWKEQFENGRYSDNQFYINVNYEFDIQKGVDDNQFNAKIDKAYRNAEYIQNYLKPFTDKQFLDTELISINWTVDFEGNPPSPTDKPTDYLDVVTNSSVNDGTLIAGVLKPIKGTKDGVKLRATCTLGVYKTNSGFIYKHTLSTVIVLYQNDVVFSSYSEVNINESTKGYVLNNSNNENIQELTAGTPIDLFEEFKLKDGNNSNYYIYNDIAKTYETANAPNNITTTKRITATLAGYDEIQAYCTYEIDNINALSFVGADGNLLSAKKTQTINGKLRVQASYLTADTRVKITITSPFGDTQGFYYINVKSSVTIDKPAGNIVTSTTSEREGVIDLSKIITVKQAKQTDNGDGSVTKETIDLKTSFEIDASTSGFADMLTDGVETINVYDPNEFTHDENDTTTYPRTVKLTTEIKPREVLNRAPVNLKLKYYIPYEVKITDSEGNEQIVLRYKEEVIEKIDNTAISMMVEPGYELTLNTAIKDKTSTPLKLLSGLDYNFFKNETYQDETKFSGGNGNIVDSFIKIKNKTTNKTLSIEDTVKVIGKLVTMQYDYPTNDKNYTALFPGDADIAIKSGIMRTRSISSNLNIPIVVKFNSARSDYIAGDKNSSTIYVNVSASVNYHINAYENEYFNEEGKIQYFQNYNCDRKIGESGYDGIIELGNYDITLFDSTSPSDNIISLRGVDNNELLGQKFNQYVLTRYDGDGYFSVTNDDNCEIIVTKNNDGSLQKLVLRIKNSVNDDVRYKLLIDTDINPVNAPYEYTFILKPNYKLVTNYPLVDSSEKVMNNSRVDLLSNYINDNNRIQTYIGNSLVTITKVVGSSTQYQLTYKDENNENSDITKLVDITNGKYITFSIITGSEFGTIENNRTLVITKAPEKTTDSLVVRATLFNGAYIDYNFEIYKNLPTVSVNTPSEVIEVYGNNTYNLLDYVSLSDENIDGLKYVFKYNNTDNLGLTVLDNRSSYRVSSNNEIIYNTGNQLNVKFDDTSEEKGVLVSFRIWTNQHVSGESYSTLKIKVFPDLRITVNENVDRIVSGNETKILSHSDSSAWLQLANENMSDIKVGIKEIAYSEKVLDGDEVKTVARTYSIDDPKTDSYSTYNIDINTVLYEQDPNTKLYGYVNQSRKLNLIFNTTNDSVTLRSNNVGSVYKLTFYVRKSYNGEKYYYTYTINLVPDIDLHSNYLGKGGSAYNLTAASAQENTFGHRTITLNGYGREGDKIIDPTDYSGTALNYSDSGSKRVTVRGYAYELNSNNTKLTSNIITTNVDKGQFNVTVKAINQSTKIFANYYADWGNDSADPYEEIINLVINPNISNDGFKYDNNNTVVNEFTAYAGSVIEINTESGLKLIENGYTALSQGQQTNASGSYSNMANVLLNTKAGGQEELYYQYQSIVTNTGSTIDCIILKSVPEATTIEISYYYDLTGKRSGLVNLGDMTPGVDYYNPNNKIKIKILPGLSSIEYNVNGSTPTPNKPENSIDLTAYFAQLFNTDSISLGSSFNIDNIKKVSDIGNFSNNLTTPNGVKIIDLFNLGYFTGNGGDIENTKTWIEGNTLLKPQLVKGIQYNVEISLGDTKNGQVEYNNFKPVENASNYYYLSDDNSTIYFIPPTISNNNTLLAKITVKLPGVNASQVVYIRHQFSGNYYIPNDTAQKNFAIGNGGTIIVTPKGFDVTNNNGIVYDKANNQILLDFTKTSSNSYDGLFTYGYQLGTMRDDSQSLNKAEYLNEKNVISIQKGNDIYYYYILDGVQLQYELLTSSKYVSIKEGKLIIDPCYALETYDASKYEFTLRVSVGSITQNYTIKLVPIILSVRATITDNVMEVFFVDKNASLNTPIQVDNANITVESESSSDVSTNINEEEKAIVNQWIQSAQYNTGSYRFIVKIVPDCKQLYRSITTAFNIKVIVGNDSDNWQLVESTKAISSEGTVLTSLYNPEFGLYENKVSYNPNTSNSVISVNLTNNFGDTTMDNLLFTNAFSSSEYNTKLYLYENNSGIDYSKYIKLTKDGVDIQLEGVVLKNGTELKYEESFALTYVKYRELKQNDSTIIDPSYVVLSDSTVMGYKEYSSLQAESSVEDPLYVIMVNKDMKNNGSYSNDIIDLRTIGAVESQYYSIDSSTYKYVVKGNQVLNDIILDYTAKLVVISNSNSDISYTLIREFSVTLVKNAGASNIKDSYSANVVDNKFTINLTGNDRITVTGNTNIVFKPISDGLYANQDTSTTDVENTIVFSEIQANGGYISTISCDISGFNSLVQNLQLISFKAHVYYKADNSYVYTGTSDPNYVKTVTFTLTYNS